MPNAFSDPKFEGGILAKDFRVRVNGQPADAVQANDFGAVHVFQL
jgi:hypothetical protein